jgi:hypothetical protein
VVNGHLKIEKPNGESRFSGIRLSWQAAATVIAVVAAMGWVVNIVRDLEDKSVRLLVSTEVASACERMREEQMSDMGALSASNERVFQDLRDRLKRIEEKVDRLQ